MNNSNTNKVARAIRLAAKSYDAQVLTKADDIDNMGEGWKEVLGYLGHLSYVAVIERGFAKDTLVLAESARGYEVGVGEAIRPYIRLYHGRDEGIAATTFVNYAQIHFPDPQLEEPNM